MVRSDVQGTHWDSQAEVTEQRFCSRGLTGPVGRTGGEVRH